MPQGVVSSRLQAGAERRVTRPVPAAELVSPLEEQPRRGARVGPGPEAEAEVEAQERQWEPAPRERRW